MISNRNAAVCNANRRNSRQKPRSSKRNWAILTSSHALRLSEEEQQTWRGFIAINQLLFDALDKQLQADANLPHTYYILLAMLSERGVR